MTIGQKDANSLRPYSGVCTILVTDIVSFNFPIDGTSPAMLTELMISYFSRSVDTIHETGGRVLQTEGDVTLALWEAEHLSPSHAELAFRCGNAILQGLEEQKRKSGRAPQLRILLSTGKVAWAPAGGRFQLWGDPSIVVKRLEEVSTRINPRKSHLLCTSETLECAGIQPVSESVARIKGTSGVEVPVYEFIAAD